MLTSCDDTRPWRPGPGPWDSEPDRAEFEHAGLPCLVWRCRASGAWAGYVHVPPYNPVLSDAYDSYGFADWPFDVHGGISWAGPRPFSGERALFCIGFDLNHYGDGAPVDVKRDGCMHGQYRGFEYAVNETRALAEQVTAYKPLEQMANIFSGPSFGLSEACVQEDETRSAIPADGCINDNNSKE